MTLDEGKFYLIDYQDPSYPCHCLCHSPHHLVSHVMPCCHDGSFLGVLRYSGVKAGDRYHFDMKSGRSLGFPVRAVVRESTESEWV